MRSIFHFWKHIEKTSVLEKMEAVMGKTGMKKLKVFSLKHPLNGWFVVFQVSL